MFTNLAIVVLLTQRLIFPLATTEFEHRIGMMYRTNWGQWAGMVFVFDRPQQVSFWMKNTPLPMKIVYTDKNLHIVEMHDGIPFNTSLLTSKTTNIQYVLELNPAYTNLIFTHYEAFRTNLLKKLKEKNL